MGASSLNLPPWLEEKISVLLQNYSLVDLQKAYENLSSRYRSSSQREQPASGYGSALETIAYAAARLPATYAVINRCLGELSPHYMPSTILDLGAGPGTASIACLERYPACSPTLIESNKDAIQLGQKLLENYPKATYKQGDLLKIQEQTCYDMVIASYVWGELTSDQQIELFRKVLGLFQDYLLLILPGTPQDFRTLIRLREFVINQTDYPDIQILAPCTHSLSCPLTGADQLDWCHFFVRLPRANFHRHLKSAQLAYEDEKFCYLLLSKKTVIKTSGRIIKNPQHRGGHGKLDVCMEGEIRQISYSRAKSPHYKEWKNLAWGDLWKAEK